MGVHIKPLNVINYDGFGVRIMYVYVFYDIIVSCVERVKNYVFRGCYYCYYYCIRARMLRCVVSSCVACVRGIHVVKKGADDYILL